LVNHIVNSEALDDLFVPYRGITYNACLQRKLWSLEMKVMGEYKVYFLED
jgi:hypothetical protein